MFNILKQFNAGGDIVGRDKITHNILPPRTQLDMLNELYREEVENNVQTKQLIEELQHYSNINPTNRDLESKLRSAGFEYIICEAEELKELVAKLIVKHQNYQSAQQIITFLLSKVESNFNTRIKPSLHNINDENTLRIIIQDDLVNLITQQLGYNVLYIFDRQVKGMMFFLTGNCHLEWQ